MVHTGVVGQALIEIAPDASKFASKLAADVKEGVDKAESSSKDSFGRLADVGQKAFLGIATAAIGFGAVAVAEALKGEEATAQLSNAVKNAGGNFDELEPKVRQVADRFTAYGYTQIQVEQGLSRLVQITGDTTQSFDLMSTAANLAAARHIDLETAATLVGKAAEGNVTALKKLGIQVDTTGTSSEKAAEAIKLLNERFGGAAQAEADTYAGKMKAFRAEIANLEERIGTALLPVLAAGAAKLGETVAFFEHNRAAAAALALVVGGPLTAALTAYLVKEAILLGEKVADFFESAASAAATAARGIAIAGTAVYEALGPVGLAIAAVSALAIAFDKSDDSAKKAGASYGQAFVDNIRGSAGETEVLTTKMHQLQAEQEALIQAELKRREQTATSGPLYAAARQTVQDTSKTYQENRAELKVLTEEQQKNTVAAKAHTDATHELNTANVEAGTTTDDLSAKLGLTAEQVQKLATGLKIDLSKEATPEAIAQLTQVAERLHVGSAVALELQDAITKLSDATLDETEKSKAFKTALDLLIGSNVDADKAVTTLYGAIDTLGQKLHENGTNLDFHTAKGRENIGVIDDTVTAIGNHVEALKRQGASAGDVQAAFDGDTNALKEQLKQAGFTATQIQSLVDRYKLVPSTINTLITADFTQLYANAAAVDQKFTDLLASKKVSGTVRTFDEGGWVPGPPGLPVPAVVHGGEFVLSRDMLRSASPATPVTVNAGAVQVSVTVHGSADPAAVAAAVRGPVSSALDDLARELAAR